MTIKQNYKMERPRFLFKFCSLSSSSFDYTKRLVLNNELYFASPLQFNDPFDCRANFDYSGNDEESLDYFIQVSIANDLIPKKFKSYHPIDIKKIIRPIVLNTKSGFKSGFSEIFSSANEQYKKYLIKLGVYCLSEIGDNILMWSHYSESHKGICLKFKSDFQGDCFLLANKVKYTNVIPKINTFKDERELIIDKSFFYKNIVWAYEKEWRIVRENTANSIINYHDESLDSIILGPNISIENTLIVEKWVGQKKIKPKIIKSYLDYKNQTIIYDE